MLQSNCLWRVKELHTNYAQLMPMLAVWCSSSVTDSVWLVRCLFWMSNLYIAANVRLKGNRSRETEHLLMKSSPELSLSFWASLLKLSMETLSLISLMYESSSEGWQEREHILIIACQLKYVSPPSPHCRLLTPQRMADLSAPLIPPPLWQ